MKPLYFAIFFVSLLPQFFFRDYTPDNELRYLSIAEENLSLGRFFAFMHHGAFYSDKPPLYIWLVMLSKSILGRHSLVLLSLFSVLPSLLLIKMMDQWTKAVLSVPLRATAGIALFTSVFFIGSTVVLRMDMLMCLFITLAQYTFYEMYTASIPLRKGQLCFGLFIFLAVLTKGPMGILVPLLSTVSFLVAKKKLRSIARYWNWRTILLLLSLCALWFLGVWLEGGKAYLYGLLVHQTVNRAVDSFHHKEPFYYYGISIWYALAPWSLFVLSVIISRVRAKIKHTDMELFFGLSALSTVLFLSVVSSKIVIYLLPAFPFIIYYTFLSQGRLSASVFSRIALALPALIFTAALPALLLFRDSVPDIDLHSPLLSLTAALLTLSGIMALVFSWQKKSYIRIIQTLGIGLLASVFAAGFSIPAFNQEIGYGTLAEKGKTLAGGEQGLHYYAWGVRRPENMDVYTGAPIQEISEEALLSGTYKPGILFINARKLEQAPQLRTYLNRFKVLQAGRHAAILLQ